MGRPLPRITIIGVANTGKSTLFNRLLGRHKALVHNQPGMTRDIFRARLDIDDRHFYLQDSGGFFAGSDIITTEINKKIFREAERSDLIIFLFDGRREMLGYEKDLYLDVIRLRKKMILAVNKVDVPEKHVVPGCYYALKRDLVLISANHNIGIEELKGQILREAAGGSADGEFDDEEIPRISVIGKPNVGKSSLINRMLNDEAVIVSHIPGTTRDSIDLEIQRNRERFILVDNAGIRKMQKLKENTESAAVVRAEQTLNRADVIILVVDISHKIDQTDLLIAGKVIAASRPVLVAANKADLVQDPAQLQSMIGELRRRFHGLFFAPIIPVSAVSGKNVFSMFDRAAHINRQLGDRLKTSELNDTINRLLTEKKYLTTGGAIFRPKYVTVESRKPFFIRFFGRIPGRLKASDERHLKRRIGEEIGLEGVPIFFKMSPTK